MISTTWLKRTWFYLLISAMAKILAGKIFFYLNSEFRNSASLSDWLLGVLSLNPGIKLLMLSSGPS